MTTYGIAKSDVVSLTADNSSLNKKTVKRLNREFGYNVIHGRCLPHTLSLVLKAKMDVLDAEFQFSSHLASIRGFINAGGGMARKLLAAEFGVCVSGIDFCDTRWASLIAAIVYMISPQTDANMKMARSRLEELAAAGDESAKAALEEASGGVAGGGRALRTRTPTVLTAFTSPLAPPYFSPPFPLQGDMKRVVWRVWYDFIETVSEKDMAKRRKEVRSDRVGGAEEDLPAVRRWILAWLASPHALAGALVVKALCGSNYEEGKPGEGKPSVATLMRITQGNPDFASKHLQTSQTGVVGTILEAVRGFLADIEGLDASDPDLNDVGKERAAQKMGRLLKGVGESSATMREELIATHKEMDIDMYNPALPFDADGAAAFQVAESERYSAEVEPKVRTALANAVAAVRESKGITKLRECLLDLEFMELFNLNKKPLEISDGDKLVGSGACAVKHITATSPPPPPAPLSLLPRGAHVRFIA